MSIILLSGCDDTALNDPYPSKDPVSNTLYTSFSERPKHLDPAQSYSSNEWAITNQVYETPLQYHYLKRPYTLEPLLATKMPKVTYVDAQGKQHDTSDDESIAFTFYEISIKPGIYYQPHPAFAQDENLQYHYHHLSEEQVEGINSISEFKHTGTRELKAEDFIFQIKRLADPTLNSPIFGLMDTYIVGLEAFQDAIEPVYKALGASLEKPSFVDLRDFPLEGVELIDSYTYRIKIKGHYPQFQYWLAMPFFAPMPWEAVKFYAQEVLVDRNLTLDWYPVGTGPYLLTENNPNQHMILAINPNYHGETYPEAGELGDKEKELLHLAGEPLPFIDTILFTLEKESIPYWNKFLQGYYDQSGVSSDSFDQAIKVTGEGDFDLTQTLQEKGIQLNTATLPTTFYWGFNMLDEVVGGLDDAKRKLRQAISIAMNMEEYIQIFMNGRAHPAYSPLPPGIAGYQTEPEGANPYVYDVINGQVKRKPIEYAKDLLKQAGFPNGIDPKTNQPLTLYFDATTAGGPDSQAVYAWIRKQFSKLGIELVVRATQYNRFQEKISTGHAQIFSWGWNADYPDPENFLFLLYGPNSKVKFGGENAVNYQNPEFDKLFDQMKSMSNGPEREAVLKEMIDLLRKDSPWVWGFHPTMVSLYHDWVAPNKPNAMSRNTLKYLKINPVDRAEKQLKWNQPILWPIWVILLVLVLLCMPAWLKYRHKILTPPTLKPKED